MTRPTLFTSFPRQWTPVAPATALAPRGLLARTVDSVPVVFVRDQAGTASALVDRCPHRSVKLSLGTRTADGCVQCPFHGWRYDAQGACVDIPFNSGVRRQAVRAATVPCREAGGLLWVFTEADPVEIAPFPDLPGSLREPGWVGSIVERPWNTHWSRAIQTMLDVAHIPYVHPQTIGFAFGRALGRLADPSLQVNLTPSGDGAFRLDWQVGAKDAPAADAGWLEFLPANGMSLGIPFKTPGRTSLLHIWCVPTTDHSSQMIVVSRRNWGLRNPFLGLFDLLTPVILKEDRTLMDSAWPSEVPAPGIEVSMPSDAPTIAFQQYYHRTFRRGVGQPTTERPPTA